MFCDKKYFNMEDAKMVLGQQGYDEKGFIFLYKAPHNPNPLLNTKGSWLFIADAQKANISNRFLKEILIVLRQGVECENYFDLGFRSKGFFRERIGFQS